MQLLILKRSFDSEGISNIYAHPETVKVDSKTILRLISEHVLNNLDNTFIKKDKEYIISHRTNFPDFELYVMCITDERVDDKVIKRWSKAVENNRVLLKSQVLGRAVNLYDNLIEDFIQEEKSFFEIEKMLGLSSEEVQYYLELLGKGTLTKPEIQRLLNKEDVDTILDKLIIKGYVKKVSAQPPQFEATPPYQTILRELDSFLSTASDLKTNVPKELEQRFSLFVNKVTKLKEDLPDTFATKFKMQFMKGFITNVVSDTLDSALKLLEEFYVSYVLDKLKESAESLLTNVATAKKIMEVLWEISQREDILVYQDFWFFRSIDSAISSINGVLERTKVNVLIIVPSIKYIDLAKIGSLPKKVRIRIATHIEDNKQSLIQLKTLPNVAIREYKRQDMFGVIRDGEEIVIGPYTKEGKTVGFGSRILEHVQRFKPLLESIWIEAEKIE